jgi:hypothetical protein
MLLFEDQVLVLTERTRMRPNYRLQTVMLEVDASDPAKLTVDRRVIFDGRCLSARLIGSTIRLAVSSTLDYPIDFVPAEIDGAEGAQARITEGAAARSEEWLPQAIVRANGERSSDGFLDSDQVRAPEDFAGAGMSSRFRREPFAGRMPSGGRSLPE